MTILRRKRLDGRGDRGRSSRSWMYRSVVEPTTDLHGTEADSRPAASCLKTENRRNIAYLAVEYLWLGLVLWGCSAGYNAWSTGRLSTPGFVPWAVVGAAPVAVSAAPALRPGPRCQPLHLVQESPGQRAHLRPFPVFPARGDDPAVLHGRFSFHHQFVNDPERDPDLMCAQSCLESHHFLISKGRFPAALRATPGVLASSLFRAYRLSLASAANLGTSEPSPMVVDRLPEIGSRAGCVGSSTGWPCWPCLQLLRRPADLRPAPK